MLPSSTRSRRIILGFFLSHALATLRFFFFFFLTLSFYNFRTSRGHRCRPFFPPVLAFNFFRA